MNIVSRASRPGLLVSFLRIPCNGLCTAQRFHTEDDSLTHYNECPQAVQHFCFFLETCYEIATKEIIFYTTSSLESSYKAFKMELWHWASLMLLFMPIISYRQGSENPGNFGDCMKRRIRFMTVVPLLPTPTHIRQSVSSQCSFHDT